VWPKGHLTATAETGEMDMTTIDVQVTATVSMTATIDIEDLLDQSIQEWCENNHSELEFEYVNDIDEVELA
jgi:hypothetical protein